MMRTEQVHSHGLPGMQEEAARLLATNWIAAGVIVAIWLLIAAYAVRLILQLAR